MPQVKVIFLIISFAILCGCKTKSPAVANNKKNSDTTYLIKRFCDTVLLKPEEFNIPIRITDNSLGYARVRCFPHFDANDTSNMIGKIKCGTTVMAHVPLGFKYDKHPYYYHVMVKDNNGKDRVGFISNLVVKPLEEVRLDSLCDIEIQKLPEEDRDGHEKQMVIKGIYTGKDLYIINPSVCRGGRCVIACAVNNGDDINDGEYDGEFGFILLDKWGGIKIGDSVSISIKHKSYATPKLLNPDALIKK